MKTVRILLWIVLLPLLPLCLAWRWSGGTTVRTSRFREEDELLTHYEKYGHQDHGGFFAHLLGTFVLAILLYGAIGALLCWIADRFAKL